MVSPAEAEYTPPVYAPVPVKVTDCAIAKEEQNGVAYEIVAVGKAVIVTEVVATTLAQPPAAAIV